MVILCHYKLFAVVAKKWNPQILINLPATNIPWCVSCNEDTWIVIHAASEHGCGQQSFRSDTHTIHHGFDEVLIEQHTVYYRQATPPIKEQA